MKKTGLSLSIYYSFFFIVFGSRCAISCLRLCSISRVFSHRDGRSFEDLVNVSPRFITVGLEMMSLLFRVTTDDHLMKHRNLTVLDTRAFCASNLPPMVKVSKKAIAMPLTLPNDDRSIVVKCPRTLWRAECWLVVHNHVLSSSALPRTIISLSGGSKRSDHQD